LALWFAALLGLVQGLTEFLPISSTAHLWIVPALLGQPDPGAAFTAVIQLGTLFAVLAYFARDLFVTIPRAFLHDRASVEGRMPYYIVVGSIPIVVFGVLLKPFIVGEARSVYVVASALAGWGIVMIAIDRFAKLSRDLAALGMRDAILIGCAQALALMPGVSRSGSTIAIALLLGFKRPDAARFSFLIGIPAILGAGVFELKDAFEADAIGGWQPLLVGTVVAAVSGYASIAWLLRYLGRRTLVPFGIYRIALAFLLAVTLL
jgi:undecaprenyl-diphosphatase